MSFPRASMTLGLNLSIWRKAPLTPQAEILLLAFKLYHARHDKNLRQKCQMLTTAVQWPRRLTILPVMLPCPRGLEDHQASVSNVVKVDIGLSHVLILILVPQDHDRSTMGKAIGLLIVLVHIVAWRHQSQTAPKPTF